MKTPLPRYVVIGGATATGKSAIAVSLAELLDGEIVGADAFQIYAGLDILTAKPAADLRARVPHHLIGEVPLREACDVRRYVETAHARIDEIAARGKLPIVCGGTGMYLRALVRGLADLPPANLEIRAELERSTLPELQARLRMLDPASVDRIDLNNPRRVIRALEICLLTGQPFTSSQREWQTNPADVRGFVIQHDRATLGDRIASRTRAMFDAGVEDEVRAIGEISATASQTLGLAEVRALIRGETDRETCITAISTATRQYAKRQATWFRREDTWQAIEIDPCKSPAVVAAQCAAALDF